MIGINAAPMPLIFTTGDAILPQQILAESKNLYLERRFDVVPTILLFTSLMIKEQYSTTSL